MIAFAAGLVALPLVYYVTEAGARALRSAYTGFGSGGAGFGYLVAAAAVVAALSLWPAAALACGVPLAAAGALFAFDLDDAMRLAARLPQVGALPGEPAGTVAGVGGLYALAGCALVLSALLRLPWRSILSG